MTQRVSRARTTRTTRTTPATTAKRVAAAKAVPRPSAAVTAGPEVVTFARAELEPELATDPLLGAVGWSWLMDAIDSVQAQVTAEAGTVTRVVSESFAGLDERPPSVEMEIRASWTPTDDDPARHLQAWLSLVCTIAGLPPLPDGVVALPGQRR